MAGSIAAWPIALVLAPMSAWGVALVEPFSIENGLLTQTLKQRRDRISERDAAAIAALYGSV